MNNFVKLSNVLLVMLISIFCAGCFQAESNLTIDEDGGVTLHNEVLGVPLIRDAIESLKNELERDNFVTEITPIASGNLTGYRIVTHYANIEQFAAQDIDIFKRTGKSKGIQQRTGWFYDAYNFDFVSEAPENSEYLDNPIAQSMMPQIKMDFVLNLPYAADSTNAHNSSNEGRTLSWNLTSSITGSRDIFIKAQFKIWHVEHIALTVAVILLLLGGTIYFYQKSSNVEDEVDAANNARFMQICACLLAAIISVSAYMLLDTVTFTDADNISAVLTHK